MDEPPLPPNNSILDPTEAERHERWALVGILQEAYDAVCKFRSAISLAEHAFANEYALYELDTQGDETKDANRRKSLSVVTHWPTIAAHAALSAIYNFSTALADWTTAASIGDWLENPNAAVDATTIFQLQFPKWDVARHAAAHSAEIRMNPEKNWHNAAINNLSGFKKAKVAGLISDSWDGRTFITTRKGELLRFEMTPQNYNRLLAVYRQLTQDACLTQQPRQRSEVETPIDGYL